MWPASNSSFGRTSMTVTAPLRMRRSSSSSSTASNSAALREIVLADALDLGESRVRQRPQLQDESDDLRVRQPIRDVRAGLLRLDQSRAAQHLEVVRRVGDALADLAGDRLDCARSLASRSRSSSRPGSTWPFRSGRSARRWPS